uniref:HTH_48 domain-containing protein n=1 Tax=Strongyloides venezuelensis TaxID=75913 RepID=A0A0K0G1C8_STRVS
MVTKQEIRIIFLYEFKKGTNAAKTAENINIVFGEGFVNPLTVQRWFKRFREGNEDLENEDQRKIKADSQQTVRRISEDLGISKNTVCHHLKQIGKTKNLAPTDFHFFKNLNQFLKDKVFKDEESIKIVFEEFIASREANFYANGINKLVSRWEQCVEANDEYF